jgi:hypothetical protein
MLKNILISFKFLFLKPITIFQYTLLHVEDMQLETNRNSYLVSYNQSYQHKRCSESFVLTSLGARVAQSV